MAFVMEKNTGIRRVSGAGQAASKNGTFEFSYEL